VPATRISIRADLIQLGILPGSVVMAQAGVRSMGTVAGGAIAIGSAGTLAAYVDFEHLDDDTTELDVPVFDKRIANAARDHGILHEIIRTWPGAIRSDHPADGGAAIGPLAEWITAGHPFNYGYGPDSPFEKILPKNGRVLMLGAPLDTITLLHYAEHQAAIPNKRVRRYRRLMPALYGPEWFLFEEFDTSEPVHENLPANAFEQIAAAYLATGRGRRGAVANPQAYLFDGADLVDFGIGWLERVVRPNQKNPRSPDAYGQYQRRYALSTKTPPQTATAENRRPAPANDGRTCRIAPCRTFSPSHNP